MLHRDRPEMLMLGPTCAPFSSLNMGWNYNRMTIERAQEFIEDGMRHLSFAAHLCIRQARQSRYFALEHPVSAASWDTEVLELLRSIPGVMEVEFDFCALGMTSTDEQGTGPVKKRTRIITNCPELVAALKICQCSRDHRHVQLVHGRASACQCYPPEFCRLVCRSVAAQLDKDAKLARARPRKKALINSLSNSRHDRAAGNWFVFDITSIAKAARSSIARWSVCAMRKAVSATFADQVETDDSGARIIHSTDCTPVFEALVEREQNEMVGGGCPEE